MLESVVDCLMVTFQTFITQIHRCPSAKVQPLTKATPWPLPNCRIISIFGYFNPVSLETWEKFLLLTLVWSRAVFIITIFALLGTNVVLCIYFPPSSHASLRLLKNGNSTLPERNCLDLVFHFFYFLLPRSHPRPFTAKSSRLSSNENNELWYICCDGV